jgi:hypothetical protein
MVSVEHFSHALERKYMGLLVLLLIGSAERRCPSCTKETCRHPGPLSNVQTIHLALLLEASVCKAGVWSLLHEGYPLVVGMKWELSEGGER